MTIFIVVYNDLSSVLGEESCSCLPDAACTAGNQSHLPLKPCKWIDHIAYGKLAITLFQIMFKDFKLRNYLTKIIYFNFHKTIPFKIFKECLKYTHWHLPFLYWKTRKFLLMVLDLICSNHECSNTFINQTTHNPKYCVLQYNLNITWYL